MSNTYLPYPSQHEDEYNKIMKDVCAALYDEFRLKFTDQRIPYAITVITLKVMAEHLGQQAKINGGNAKLELHKFGEMAVVNRESDDGEKSGNLVPMFIPGETFKMAVKDDADTEKTV